MGQTNKPKRIKRVFSSSDQVIHLWANQSQDAARAVLARAKPKLELVKQEA